MRALLPLLSAHTYKQLAPTDFYTQTTIHIHYQKQSENQTGGKNISFFPPPKRQSKHWAEYPNVLGLFLSQCNSEGEFISDGQDIINFSHNSLKISLPGLSYLFPLWPGVPYLGAQSCPCVLLPSEFTMKKENELKDFLLMDRAELFFITFQ